MANIIKNLYYAHNFKNHYNILERNGYKERNDFDRLYQELYILNRNAVIERYNEEEDSDYIKLPQEIDWSNGRLDRYQALKSMCCLRYQCSEGDVPETKMFKFLEDLIHCWQGFIINMMPEYEKAEWD